MIGLLSTLNLQEGLRVQGLGFEGLSFTTLHLRVRGEYTRSLVFFLRVQGLAWLIKQLLQVHPAP